MPSDGRLPDSQARPSTGSDHPHRSRPTEPADPGLDILRACHRTLVTARSPGTAAAQVSQQLASSLPSRFVWIGIADDSNVLRPLAHAGTDGGYLESGAWRGGLEAAALTERRILSEEEPGDALDPWREQLCASGFVSALALPLGTDAPFGVLALFDNGPGQAPPERQLLPALAEDISHGLHALLQREARERLFAVVEAAPEAIATLTPGGVLTYCNTAAAELLGEPVEGLLGRRLAVFQPAWAAATANSEALPTAVSEGYWQGESAVLHSDGSEVPVLKTLLRHEHPDGGFVSAVLSDRRRGRRECARQLHEELARDCLFSASAARPSAQPPIQRAAGKLPVVQAQRTLMLDPAAVAYLRADGHYTHVHTEREAHLSGQQLSHLERLLDPARFLRTHRSYIVNMDYIAAVERRDKQLEVVLNTRRRDRIPISRRSAEGVRQALGLT